MAYPTTLDSFINPAATDQVSVVSHSGQHTNANNAIAAIEAKVGINGSAVTTSHDYKLSLITGADKAIGAASPTIVTPTIASFTNAQHNHQNAAGGGQLAESALALTDITTNDVSTSKHGFMSKLPGGTTTFYRGDGTFAAPGSSTSLTLLVRPNFPLQTNTTGGIDGDGTNSNTTLRVAQVIIPFQIIVNKISIYSIAVSVAGTVKLVLYSEDGQTKYFEVTTASISGAGMVTTAVSAVTVPAGVYYLGILPVGTASLSPAYWIEETTITSHLFSSGIASEPVIAGSVTVTASTIPATITPTSVTWKANAALVARLDN